MPNELDLILKELAKRSKFASKNTYHEGYSPEEIKPFIEKPFKDLGKLPTGSDYEVFLKSKYKTEDLYKAPLLESEEVALYNLKELEGSHSAFQSKKTPITSVNDPIKLMGKKYSLRQLREETGGSPYTKLAKGATSTAGFINSKILPQIMAAQMGWGLGRELGQTPLMTDPNTTYDQFYTNALQKAFFNKGNQ